MNKWTLQGNSLVLDSFDGAEHSLSPKKHINIVFYSSQLFSTESINAGISTSTCIDIFT